MSVGMPELLPTALNLASDETSTQKQVVIVSPKGLALEIFEVNRPKIPVLLGSALISVALRGFRSRGQRYQRNPRNYLMKEWPGPTIRLAAALGPLNSESSASLSLM